VTRARAEPAAAAWSPRSFVERIGAALVAPGRAMAAADGAGADAAAGQGPPARTGGDVAVLVVLGFVAIHAPAVTAALWVALADSPGAGLTALAGVFSRAVGPQLLFLLCAGLIVTALAGSRRSVGRDYDLAFVAYVPLLVVEAAATLALALAGADGSETARRLVGVVAYGWAGAVLVVAVRCARRRLPRGTERP
jgi:hypothetical protein